MNDDGYYTCIVYDYDSEIKYLFEVNVKSKNLIMILFIYFTLRCALILKRANNRSFTIIKTKYMFIND